MKPLESVNGIMNVRRLRLGMAQLNMTVGDFKGNVQKILETIDKAQALGVDLLTFPELAICGYPPEDLLFKPSFIRENLKSLEEVVHHVPGGMTAVVGFVDAKNDLFNAAAIIHDGKLAHVYHKIYLPNYGVFDENRYFHEGKDVPVCTINGVGVGVNICEDIWYGTGPTAVQAYSGAEVIVNISSSPFYAGRSQQRLRMLSARASDNICIVAYTNVVGGQDELVFDGNSMVVNEKGELIARGKQFEEDLVVADLDVDAVFSTRLHDPRWRKETIAMSEENYQVSYITVSEKPSAAEKPFLPPRIQEQYDPIDEIYRALVLGTRDYVHKNGFKKVIIGISGGVDSSMVATIAVDALGKENVVGISMPSRYSSPGSKSDAQLLCDNLGMKLLHIPIEPVFQAYLDTLAKPFKGTEPNVAEENIQARIRGNLLMALSNKFGWLVLTTGDKSEMATGFTTLYGDMAGGFAVIKDVPKTQLYRLAKYRNAQAGKELIPRTVLEKEPSPELKADQKASDLLPPYYLLDPILTAYVEEDRSVEQIISLGFEANVVKKAARLVDTSEYKRRQAPPGIKITPRAFGRDRRLPITNRFKQY